MQTYNDGIEKANKDIESFECGLIGAGDLKMKYILSKGYIMTDEDRGYRARIRDYFERQGEPLEG